MDSKNKQSRTKVVAIPLKDDEIDSFERYKAESFLRADSEAARKLVLERLRDLKQLSQQEVA